MTDTSSLPPRFMMGRKPMRPEGERFPIPYLHELDAEVGPDVAVTYPVDVSQGITDWLMLGNGPDPTLTIVTPNGPGGPVGNCFYAGKDHDKMLSGYQPTANGTVGQYDIYEADSQGVSLGQEQDEGVVMADALLWCHTHNEAGLLVPPGQGDVEPVSYTHLDVYKRQLLPGAELAGPSRPRADRHGGRRHLVRCVCSWHQRHRHLQRLLLTAMGTP